MKRRNDGRESQAAGLLEGACIIIEAADLYQKSFSVKLLKSLRG